MTVYRSDSAPFIGANIPDDEAAAVSCRESASINVDTLQRAQLHERAGAIQACFT